MVLAPGEQAYWTAGKLRKREVDVNTVLAWVDGLFVFEHDELSYVINQLSRWYDVEFRFKDEKLKEFQFTGTVNRDEGLDGILNLMERMNVVLLRKERIYLGENDKVKAYN
ncbi:MAG: FecR domain-containing protein [Butyricimonas faecihominis]